jgi:hypothetical protein
VQIDLFHHFDHNGFFASASQDGKHRGQQAGKLRVDDATSYGKNYAEAGCRVVV